MSYILDALKKVEHEKLKKSVPGGMISITGELFQTQVQQPVVGGRWKIVVLIAVASLVTFAGTWLLLRNKKTEAVKITAPVAFSPAISVDTSVPTVPLATSAPATNRVMPLIPQSLPPTTSERDNNVVETRRPPSLPGQPVGVQPANQSIQSIQPPADIKLSGIAWQDERSARRAVVNGFLIKEGAVVSGARIVEIMADRVRFVLSGKAFEIKLDSAPVGEGGQ